MIAVGMMDRKIVLYKRTQSVDGTYGGINTITYTADTEEIWSHVIWKGGKVDEKGEQMQNNQVVEFYCRNGGAMASSDVEDYIEFESNKHYIDMVNVVDGREKYLQIITSQVSV
jgi:ketosteroid isomerase-like protein